MCRVQPDRGEDQAAQGLEDNGRKGVPERKHAHFSYPWGHPVQRRANKARVGCRGQPSVPEPAGANRGWLRGAVGYEQDLQQLRWWGQPYGHVGEPRAQGQAYPGCGRSGCMQGRAQEDGWGPRGGSRGCRSTAS